MLLLPKQCFGCSAFIGGLFCDYCESLLMPSLKKNTLFSQKHYFFVEYNTLVKDVFHYIKFSDQQHLLSYFSNLLLELTITPLNYDYWIPVPYHHSRLDKRGYNLLDRLFGCFFEQLGIPKLDILNRIIKTEHLFDKSLSERQIILSRAFSFKHEPSMIKNKKILLVDDIVTTGSTMKECLSLFVSTDVSKISVLSFAKVVLDYDKAA